MAQPDFRTALAGGGQLFLDGAMGTMLQAAGMPAGASPEKFCLANPATLENIHLSYLRAGADILTSCTFGANPFKMPPGLDVFEFNRDMVKIARRAIAESGRDGPMFVAGNVGPSGKFARPLGDIEPEELVSGFARQIEGLVAGGCDLVFIETQFDLAEARAAVAAARRVCDLPVMVSMTFEQGRSLTGSTPEIFAETMLNLGCDAVGTNCSLGPDEMLPVVRELLAVCSCPVMAEPNAGLPVLENGKTVFPLDPAGFAEKTARFAAAGVQIVGGCCGTTPAHIAALSAACRNAYARRADIPSPSGITLTSRSGLVRIGAGEPLAIIGERINPTGKPKLAEELANGEYREATALADAQAAAGAAALDVNVGAHNVDESKALPDLVSLLSSRSPLPLSLDSSNVSAIAAALPYYPGSCLINSISGEKGRMNALGPLCRDYGAPFILLPLAGAQLPEKAVERIRIIERLLEQAQAIGIARRLVIVDILALSISSSPMAALECLKTLEWCRENGLPTTIGLSNISFGMPARDLLNATFMAMARGAGLSSCIANPGAPRAAEAFAALRLLGGHDPDGGEFIASFAGWKADKGGERRQIAAATAQTLRDAVILGDRENVIPILEKELARGLEPFAIVNDILIPAITEVGDLYERKEYFLPQLIRSAETMRKAFDRLKPLLEKAGGGEHRPVVVMATVEGDIHDIGKNIVCLLLGNHGFEVIDLGKDVPAGKIVACAREKGAAIIGLSALMTTTMVRMEDTIRLVKEENLPVRVMVGGAAVTRKFAEDIGADAYCRDAVESVAWAKRFTGAEQGPSVSANKGTL